jgi:hypothetical protein
VRSKILLIWRQHGNNIVRRKAKAENISNTPDKVTTHASLIPSNSRVSTFVKVRTETSEEIDCESNKPVAGTGYS